MNNWGGGGNVNALYGSEQGRATRQRRAVKAIYVSKDHEVKCGDAVVRTVGASSLGDRAEERVAQGRGSRGERQEGAERAGQSDTVVSSKVYAREMMQQ